MDNEKEEIQKMEVAPINSLRESISDNIEEARAIIEAVEMPAKAEVILALRKLEEARMRLGTARTYLQGKDPFVES